MATTTEKDATKDELAERRASNGNGNGNGRLTPEQLAGGTPIPPEEDGKSMEEMERDGTAVAGEEEDGQMFVMEQGRKVTLGTLIGRGTPVTYEVKLTGRSLKGPGSLIAFSSPDVTLVALGRAGRVITDPTYNEDGSVKSVHIAQEIKTRSFYDASTEAGQVALRGEG